MRTGFAGFATLPTPDPDAAAEELERSVTGLGFKGALINGHTGGRFLDNPVLLADLRAGRSWLGVPVYLHPTYPTAQVVKTFYAGFEAPFSATLATASWGWHAPTRAAHAAAHPGRRVRPVPGPAGDHWAHGRMPPRSGWPAPTNKLNPGDKETSLKHRVADYFHANFYITTSGYCTDPPLLCPRWPSSAPTASCSSFDFPFSRNADSHAFLDERAEPLGEEDRAKMAHGNAERLLGL